MFMLILTILSTNTKYEYIRIYPVFEHCDISELNAIFSTSIINLVLENINLNYDKIIDLYYKKSIQKNAVKDIIFQTKKLILFVINKKNSIEMSEENNIQLKKLQSQFNFIDESCIEKVIFDDIKATIYIFKVSDHTDKLKREFIRECVYFFMLIYLRKITNNAESLIEAINFIGIYKRENYTIINLENNDYESVYFSFKSIEKNVLTTKKSYHLLFLNIGIFEYIFSNFIKIFENNHINTYESQLVNFKLVISRFFATEDEKYIEDDKIFSFIFNIKKTISELIDDPKNDIDLFFLQFQHKKTINDAFNFWLLEKFGCDEQNNKQHMNNFYGIYHYFYNETYTFIAKKLNGNLNNFQTEITKDKIYIYIDNI